MEIDELSAFSNTPALSVTRVLYRLSGLSVKEDAVRNIYEPEFIPVSTGSHIDTILYFGKCDGVVGVLGAIETINVLKWSGFKPKRSLEVIMFTLEEPKQFAMSRLGSRLLAGTVELVELLKSTMDSQNISFSDAAKFDGYNNSEDLSSVFLDKGSYSAFIELHNYAYLQVFLIFMTLDLQLAMTRQLKRQQPTSTGWNTDDYEVEAELRNLDRLCESKLLVNEMWIENANYPWQRQPEQNYRLRRLE
ncbi:hypothetical protein BUALT_Bualt12G0075700 [Buddleja alternifolia]|uniref:Uncharacterized protein n=1 Tax=Buddleja alternifolia TaxID=168488 RepID=A0AAV6WU94_9LAMI|nr:hypothetical protein BUALT_Bualt12G0075700 [Buddleja alternifolia]